MHNWLNQHQQAFGLVVGRLKQQWMSTLLIMTVIGVTLAIPSLIYVMLQNASTLVHQVKQETQLSVFLKPEVSDSNIEVIKTRLAEQSDISEFTFVSKEAALKQLMETTNNPELISSLNQNPLPHAFFVTPASLQSEALASLKTSLQSMEGVAEVIVDSAWVNRLNSILNIGTKVVWIFGCLLGFALVAVISNTVRMQILTHKEEIEVSELFGATQSFIRRPFLYLGTLYGFGGGMIACCLLTLILYQFNQSILQLAQEYASDIHLQISYPITYGSMIVLSVMIGWLASYMAIALKSTQR